MATKNSKCVEKSRVLGWAPVVAAEKLDPMVGLQSEDEEALRSWSFSLVACQTDRPTLAGRMKLNIWVWLIADFV